jgi:hypothetical protein
MAITAVSNGVTQAVQNVSDTTAISATSSTDTSKASTTSANTDSSTVSGPAQLLAKLKSLQESDPAKFKEVVKKLSDTLRTDAKVSTDANEQRALTDLASKFETAGQTGNLSALSSKRANEPPPDPPPAGAAPPGDRPPPPPRPVQDSKGAGSNGVTTSTNRATATNGTTTTNSATTATSATSVATSNAGASPADTNRDGKVSGAEQQAYQLSQFAEQATGASAYAKVADEGRQSRLKSTLDQLTSVVNGAV